MLQHLHSHSSLICYFCCIADYRSDVLKSKVVHCGIGDLATCCGVLVLRNLVYLMHGVGLYGNPTLPINMLVAFAFLHCFFKCTFEKTCPLVTVFFSLLTDLNQFFFYMSNDSASQLWKMRIMRPERREWK